MSHLGQRLSALVDGELAATERDRVLAHLACCETCRHEVIALRALKRRMNALAETTADTSLVQRLLAMPPPAGHPGPARPRRVSRRRLAAVTAASSLAVMAGLAAAAFLAGGGTPQPGPTVTPAVDMFMLQHAITPVPGPGPGQPAQRAPSPFQRPGAP